MEASPEVIGSLLLVVGVLRVSRMRPRFANKADKMIHELEAGICPECSSVHPEAATHDGPDNFWVNFKCPECNYTMNAHVHHSKPTDA